MKPYFQRGIALGALLALAVGGGCKVGSDYQSPNVAKQVSASYSETKEEAQVSLQTGEDVSSWWRQINDPVLAQLTQDAVSGSLTLQEALFRIQAARAALGSTNSNLLPQFAQDGGYAHQTYGGHSQSVFSTATSMSWELDVFGRIQRSIEAANADMEVQRWLYRDAYVILVADVAQAYVDARSYQDQIRSAKISILVQQCIVDYVKNNVEAGRMAPLDISRAVAPMRTTEATLSTLETQYQQAINRLCILLGRPTGDDYVASTLLDDRALPTMEELRALINSEQEADREKFVAIMRNLFLEDLRTPKAPEALLVGIPADLLRRRPDVRAAEQRIVAQNARVGVAVADLYPMFTLSGSFGLEANSFSNMFDSDSIAAGVGPAFRWNILNFGKYRFNIEAQRFMQEELIASYRQTVLEAAEDVDNALVSYANESGRNVKLEQAVEAYLDVLDKTLVIKSAGAGDIQPILEAAAGLVSNGLQFVQSKGNQTSSIVRLYRALGGDWDAAPADPVEAVAPVASDYDPKEDWERRQAESEIFVADALAAAQPENEVVVENADFEIVADDELEASPELAELAEPVVATVDESYADEALIVE
ncbi:MAG: TolC family protein [Thermoguttaceae bacterium]|nr:TolC family protein [Thermoguttaceae bacterium]